MIILLAALFLIGIGLAVYAFLPSQKDAERFTDESMPLHLPPSPELTEFRQAPAAVPPAGVNNDLEHLRAEHKHLQSELELANSMVKTMKEEMSKAAASAGSAENTENLKKENAQLKDGLAAKDRELAQLKEKGATRPEGYVSKEEYDGLNKNFSDALAKIKSLQDEAATAKKDVQKYADYDQLKAAAADQAGKLEAANKDNAGLANKVKLLEEQIEEFKKQEAALKADLEAAQKPGEEQVPKKDFDALNARLNEELSRVEADRKESSEAENKVKLLEMQIAQYKKEAEALAVKAGDSVPKKDYDELKKRLEEAEEVLKIVHGAGE